MSNIKISELPEVTSLTPTDVLPSVTGGVTSKITVQNLASSLTTVNTAISAINAGTALSATSASYASTAKSASYSLTSVSASYASNSTSASYALTASYAFNAVNSLNAVSASYALNSTSASYAISSSYSVTSSYANSAVSASYVASASYATNASTASYVTASNVYGPYGSNSVISSSYALTASYALNGGGGGSTFPYSGNAVISGSLTVTGSVTVIGDANLTASYAYTASYVDANNVYGPYGASSVLTASYALNGGGGGPTSTLTRFWVENVTQSIQPDETIVVSDNYVMKNCLLILSGSAEYYDVGPLNFSKKAELIVGGHILFVDCQIINDGLISVAGGIVLSGSSTITGTGTII